MSWRDAPIPNTDEGLPMFLGNIDLVNDKNELLGSVLWFYDDGPFYAHAADLTEPTVIRRIGPHTTLEGAKASVMEVVEGRKDVRARAGYPR